MAFGANPRYGLWLLVVLSALGLIASLLYYFLPHTGVDGALGVLIVIVSTALMLAASAALALWALRGAARGVLLALILLDILGTGLAAYMLEADYLLALMALALIAWAFELFARPRPRPSVPVEAMP